MPKTLYYELYKNIYGMDKSPIARFGNLTDLRAHAYLLWKKGVKPSFTIVRVYTPNKYWTNLEKREEYGELFLASAPHPKTLWFNAYGRAGTFTYGEVLPNGKGIQYKP